MAYGSLLKGVEAKAANCRQPLMWRFLRGISLSWWIVIATVLGAVVGYLDHDVWVNTNVGAALNPLSTIFLRMIKSLIVPLIFAHAGGGHRGPRRRHEARRPAGVQVASSTSRS